MLIADFKAAVVRSSAVLTVLTRSAPCSPLFTGCPPPGALRAVVIAETSTPFVLVLMRNFGTAALVG